MEPEDDLRIRKKVMEWESQTPSLDTDKLWMRHSVSPMHGQERNIVFYYAAATLVLASAIIYYGFQQTERESIQLRIKEIELALQQGQPTPEVQSNPATVATPCPEQPTVQQPRRMTARRTSDAPIQPRSERTVTNENSDRTQVVDLTPLQPEANIQSADPAPLTPEITSQPRVILGRMSQETIKDHYSRLRVTLFRNDDVSGEKSGSTPPVVVLAGINN